MGKRWRIQPHDATRVTQLEKTAGIPAVVAQLLVGRGVFRADTAMEFLEAKMSGLRDPEELPGLTAAADHLADGIQRQRRIAIYGDYDADGMTSTSILVRCLRLLGGDVTFVLGGSGHIAGVINPPGEREKYGYWTGADCPENPEDWLERATRTKGSWWPAWAEWLEAKDRAKRVAARVPGDQKLQVLEEAPGSYVLTQ